MPPQEFSRGKEKLGFYLPLGERLFSKSFILSQNFPFSDYHPLLLAGRHVHGSHPLPVLPGRGPDDAQPGMPPASPLQLQIDTVLQEFQLADQPTPSWSTTPSGSPSSSLGNKVTVLHSWAGGPVPRTHARSLPVLRSSKAGRRPVSIALRPRLFALTCPARQVPWRGLRSWEA